MYMLLQSFLKPNGEMMQKDYYDILSVPRNGSQEDIKKAFRKLALKYHPDRNKNDPSAEKKFKEAASAYEVLGNPKKRKQYDQFGHAGVESRFSSAGAYDIRDIFSSFKDIFEGGDFFSRGFDSFFSGGRFAESSPVRGADLRYRLEVSLIEVLTGVNKTISYEVELNCESCQGSGARPNTGKKTCLECQGTGRLTRRQGFFAFSSVCPTCQGEGTLIESPCGICFGTGRKKKKVKLVVPVPAGVGTGTHLRLSQKGMAGYKGGSAGDLYVQIQVAEHKYLKRQGADLIGSVKVSYLQALLGGRVQAHSLQGKIEIMVPKGTQSGDFVTLKKEGLVDISSKKRGNLLYQVEVQIPSKLKRKEEELLKEIAKLKGEAVF